MAHYWMAQLQASSLMRTATPASVEAVLELLLDDGDVFSAVARGLGIGEELPGGELEFSRWMGSLERPPSAAERAEVMELVGLPVAAYEHFQRSPRDLPAAYMERGAWYWMMHNLLAPPGEQIWASALSLRITPFGDNGPPLLERASPSTFALRLLVELGVAAGGEHEAGPIVDYFRGRGDSWPAMAGSEDDAGGIVWAASIRPAEGSEPAWTVVTSDEAPLGPIDAVVVARALERVQAVGELWWRSVGRELGPSPLFTAEQRRASLPERLRPPFEGVAFDGPDLARSEDQIHLVAAGPLATALLARGRLGELPVDADGDLDLESLDGWVIGKRSNQDPPALGVRGEEIAGASILDLGTHAVAVEAFGDESVYLMARYG